MTSKVFNTEETSMKKFPQDKMDAVADAFERFDKGNRFNIPAPRRFSLGAKFDERYCCQHEWAIIPPIPENKSAMQLKFDEQEIGDEQKICIKCKAYSLWENGHLFAYDAIVIDEEKQESPKASRRQARR